MTHPLGTKEQREELRQVLGTPGSLYSARLRGQMLDTVQPALDGLDIAEEAMRARAVIDYLFKHNWDMNFLPEVWSHWIVAAQTAEDTALRRWRAWKAE